MPSRARGAFRQSPCGSTSLLLVILCVFHRGVVSTPSPPTPATPGGPNSTEVDLTATETPINLKTVEDATTTTPNVATAGVMTTAATTAVSPSTTRFRFSIPPIPENARDVHEVRIVELGLTPHAYSPPPAPPTQDFGGSGDSTTDHYGEGVDSRSRPLIQSADVRPQNANQGERGYHLLLDQLWLDMNISKSCILYNNFDAVRSCDCLACMRAEPDFRSKLCEFGRAVRNSSEIEEYVVRVMGPRVPRPSEVFMLDDFYAALCDPDRCPSPVNRCCYPPLNPGALDPAGAPRSPADFYQVDAYGCPVCHPVVPLGTALPSVDRSCILEELLSFAPLPPPALPSHRGYY